MTAAEFVEVVRKGDDKLRVDDIVARCVQFRASRVEMRGVPASKVTALNFLKGQMMKLSKGKANPGVPGETLERKLKG
jgi:Asp-tRNA(Asn)/Glu-tRNA(Gln) amidotransferase B subunit